MSYSPASPPSGYHIHPTSPPPPPPPPPRTTSSSSSKRPSTSSKFNSMNRPTKTSSISGNSGSIKSTTNAYRQGGSQSGRRSGGAGGVGGRKVNVNVNVNVPSGSRAPSVFSSRSRPGSIAGSDVGKTSIKFGPRSGSIKGGAGGGAGGPGYGARMSRPGSTRPMSEYARDLDDPLHEHDDRHDDEEDDDDEDDEPDFEGSDYGDQDQYQDEEDDEEDDPLNPEGEMGRKGRMKRDEAGNKRVLSLEEERLVRLIKERDEGMESLRRMMDKDQQRRYDEYKSTNFTFQSIQKVYRDRYPGAGHIAKNVAGLIGVVAKAHVGEIIELAKTIQLERMRELERSDEGVEGSMGKTSSGPPGKGSTGLTWTAGVSPEASGGITGSSLILGTGGTGSDGSLKVPNPTSALSVTSPAQTTTTTTTPNPSVRPKPKPLTANDLKEAYAMYLEQTRQVRGTVGGRMGEERKVGLFGGWM